MLVGIKDGIADDFFFNLHNYLTPGDLIIFNDSKVLSSRMNYIDNNVNKEIFIEKILSEFEAFCLLGNFKGLNQGDNYMIGNDLEFTYLSSLGSLKHLRFKQPIEKLISSFGQIPLPPYIKRKPNTKDSEFYQTVYANAKGSVAAPTAGLHFDYDLISKIKEKGILTDNITLHVGAATFLPIKEQNIKNHEMHSESVFISKELKKKIISVKENKKKIYAVGTTSLRALESIKNINDESDETFDTNLFIKPGYKFKIVDRLITNFHASKSSLFVLVKTFSKSNIDVLYDHAINQKYLFLSYGDAMLIER